MLKKNLSALTTGILFAFAGLNAHAESSGTINFTGTVIADSCSIDVNNSGSNTGTVPLPINYTSWFDGAGDGGSQTGFNVTLTGCDSQINQFAMSFSGDTPPTDDAILETTGSAKNIGIKLYDISNGGAMMTHKVAFSGEAAESVNNLYWQNAIKTGDSSTAANFTYIAEVVQVGEETPTPGAYNATVNFVVHYQ